MRKLKVTSWVGVHGSTSMTGNVRDALKDASPPRIRESLLEGSNESLLKTSVLIILIVWTVIWVVQPKPLELLNSVSTQDQRVPPGHSRADTSQFRPATIVFLHCIKNSIFDQLETVEEFHYLLLPLLKPFHPCPNISHLEHSHE